MIPQLTSLQCVQCGQYHSGLHYCALPARKGGYGNYTFTPNPLTADDIRKIVREELERAKGDTR